ncbi:MAG: energy-coupling factor ABC transporter permease [Gammaproteobacteria bacterium]|nr:energy-coupling factor ABC transporter permease [Gammaproteobacteria bacterium]
MNLVSAGIPAVWRILTWIAFAILALLTWRRAAWHMMRSAENANVFLAATFVVLGLWLIHAGIQPGLEFHLVGATALTLMFGPWFAMFSLALVVAGITAHTGQYAAYAANVLVMGAVPVGVSWAIYRFVDRRLPNNIFVYIFLNSFFGAGFAAASVGLASTAFAVLCGTYRFGYLLDNYLVYYLLLAWAESFNTGMVITLLVVYRPQWISTFDDGRYLRPR